MQISQEANLLRLHILTQRLSQQPFSKDRSDLGCWDEMLVNKQQMVLWMETKGFGEPPIWRKERVGYKRIRNRWVSSLREGPTKLLSKFVPGESLWREAATTEEEKLESSSLAHRAAWLLHEQRLCRLGQNKSKCLFTDAGGFANNSFLLETSVFLHSSWQKALSSKNKWNSSNYRNARWALLPCSHWTPITLSQTTGWESGKPCFSSRGWDAHTLYLLSSPAENLHASSSLSFDVHPEMGEFPSSLRRQWGHFQS